MSEPAGELAIAFALSARAADADGFEYYKEIRCLQRAGALPSVMRGRLQDLLGGYVFIVDGMIWNALEPTRFDPEHIRFPADTLIFAAGLLADLVTELGQQGRVVCMLWEMASLHIDLEPGSMARITAVDHDGATIFAPTPVNLRCLLEELLRATDEFLAIGDDEITRRARLETGDGDQGRAPNPDREFLDSWRRSADQLRDLLAEWRGVGTGPLCS